MGRVTELLKTKFINWLFKDVEFVELRVKRIKVGDGTIVVTLDYWDLAPLTADPPLAAGRMWYRSDLETYRYSPDGVGVVDF